MTFPGSSGFFFQRKNEWYENDIFQLWLLADEGALFFTRELTKVAKNSILNQNIILQKKHLTICIIYMFMREWVLKKWKKSKNPKGSSSFFLQNFFPNQGGVDQIPTLNNQKIALKNSINLGGWPVPTLFILVSKPPGSMFLNSSRAHA